MSSWNNESLKKHCFSLGKTMIFRIQGAEVDLHIDEKISSDRKTSWHQNNQFKNKKKPNLNQNEAKKKEIAEYFFRNNERPNTKPPCAKKER